MAHDCVVDLHHEFERALDEIALEGEQGIDLESLWRRLGGLQYNLKAFLWTWLAEHPQVHIVSSSKGQGGTSWAAKPLSRAENAGVVLVADNSLRLRALGSPHPSLFAASSLSAASLSVSVCPSLAILQEVGRRRAAGCSVKEATAGNTEGDAHFQADKLEGVGLLSKQNNYFWRLKEQRANLLRLPRFVGAPRDYECPERVQQIENLMRRNGWTVVALADLVLLLGEGSTKIQSVRREIRDAWEAGKTDLRVIQKEFTLSNEGSTVKVEGLIKEDYEESATPEAPSYTSTEKRGLEGNKEDEDKEEDEGDEDENEGVLTARGGKGRKLAKKEAANPVDENEMNIPTAGPGYLVRKLWAVELIDTVRAEEEEKAVVTLSSDAIGAATPSTPHEVLVEKYAEVEEESGKQKVIVNPRLKASSGLVGGGSDSFERQRSNSRYKSQDKDICTRDTFTLAPSAPSRRSGSTRPCFAVVVHKSVLQQVYESILRSRDEGKTAAQVAEELGLRAKRTAQLTQHLVKLSLIASIKVINGRSVQARYYVPEWPRLIVPYLQDIGEDTDRIKRERATQEKAFSTSIEEGMGNARCFSTESVVGSHVDEAVGQGNDHTSAEDARAGIMDRSQGRSDSSDSDAGKLSKKTKGRSTPHTEKENATPLETGVAGGPRRSGGDERSFLIRAKSEQSTAAVTKDDVTGNNVKPPSQSSGSLYPIFNQSAKQSKLKGKQQKECSKEQGVVKELKEENEREEVVTAVSDVRQDNPDQGENTIASSERPAAASATISTQSNRQAILLDLLKSEGVVMFTDAIAAMRKAEERMKHTIDRRTVSRMVRKLEKEKLLIFRTVRAPHSRFARELRFLVHPSIRNVDERLGREAQQYLARQLAVKTEKQEKRPVRGREREIRLDRSTEKNGEENERQAGEQLSSRPTGSHAWRVGEEARSGGEIVVKQEGGMGALRRPDSPLAKSFASATSAAKHAPHLTHAQSSRVQHNLRTAQDRAKIQGAPAHADPVSVPGGTEGTSSLIECHISPTGGGHDLDVKVSHLPKRRYKLDASEPPGEHSSDAEYSHNAPTPNTHRQHEAAPIVQDGTEITYVQFGATGDTKSSPARTLRKGLEPQEVKVKQRIYDANSMAHDTTLSARTVPAGLERVQRLTAWPKKYRQIPYQAARARELHIAILKWYLGRNPCTAGAGQALPPCEGKRAKRGGSEVRESARNDSERVDEERKGGEVSRAHGESLEVKKEEREIVGTRRIEASAETDNATARSTGQGHTTRAGGANVMVGEATRVDFRLLDVFRDMLVEVCLSITGVSNRFPLHFRGDLVAAIERKQKVAELPPEVCERLFLGRWKFISQALHVLSILDLVHFDSGKVDWLVGARDAQEAGESTLETEQDRQIGVHSIVKDRETDAVQRPISRSGNSEVRPGDEAKKVKQIDGDESNRERKPSATTGPTYSGPVSGSHGSEVGLALANEGAMGVVGERLRMTYSLYLSANIRVKLLNGGAETSDMASKGAEGFPRVSKVTRDTVEACEKGREQQHGIDISVDHEGGKAEAQAQTTVLKSYNFWSREAVGEYWQDLQAICLKEQDWESRFPTFFANEGRALVSRAGSKLALCYSADLLYTRSGWKAPDGARGTKSGSKASKKHSKDRKADEERGEQALKKEKGKKKKGNRGAVIAATNGVAGEGLDGERRSKTRNASQGQVAKDAKKKKKKRKLTTREDKGTSSLDTRVQKRQRRRNQDGHEGKHWPLHSDVALIRAALYQSLDKIVSEIPFELVPVPLGLNSGDVDAFHQGSTQSATGQKSETSVTYKETVCGEVSLAQETTRRSHKDEGRLRSKVMYTDVHTSLPGRGAGVGGERGQSPSSVVSDLSDGSRGGVGPAMSGNAPLDWAWVAERCGATIGACRDRLKALRKRKVVQDRFEDLQWRATVLFCEPSLSPHFYASWRKFRKRAGEEHTRAGVLKPNKFEDASATSEPMDPSGVAVNQERESFQQTMWQKLYGRESKLNDEVLARVSRFPCEVCSTDAQRGPGEDARRVPQGRLAPCTSPLCVAALTQVKCLLLGDDGGCASEGKSLQGLTSSLSKYFSRSQVVSALRYLYAIGWLRVSSETDEQPTLYTLRVPCMVSRDVQPRLFLRKQTFDEAAAFETWRDQQASQAATFLAASSFTSSSSSSFASSFSSSSSSSSSATKTTASPSSSSSSSTTTTSSPFASLGLPLSSVDDVFQVSSISAAEAGRKRLKLDKDFLSAGAVAHILSSTAISHSKLLSLTQTQAERDNVEKGAEEQKLDRAENTTDVAKERVEKQLQKNLVVEFVDEDSAGVCFPENTKVHTALGLVHPRGPQTMTEPLLPEATKLSFFRIIEASGSRGITLASLARRLNVSVSTCDAFVRSFLEGHDSFAQKTNSGRRQKDVSDVESIVLVNGYFTSRIVSRKHIGPWCFPSHNSLWCSDNNAQDPRGSTFNERDRSHRSCRNDLKAKDEAPVGALGETSEVCIASPTRLSGGDANVARLQRLYHGLVTLILLNPGITQTELVRRAPLLSPAELLELLTGLETMGAITCCEQFELPRASSSQGHRREDATTQKHTHTSETETRAGKRRVDDTTSPQSTNTANAHCTPSASTSAVMETPGSMQHCIYFPTPRIFTVMGQCNFGAGECSVALV